VQEPLPRPQVDGRPGSPGPRREARAHPVPLAVAPQPAAEPVEEQMRWRDVMPFGSAGAPKPWGSQARLGILPASPPPEVQTVSVSAFAVAFRIAWLLVAMLYLGIARFLDWLILDRLFTAGWEAIERRDVRLTLRRAARLRDTLIWLGGTYIKIGQQLAIRSDIMSPAFCEALAELLDKVPEIPKEKVRQAIADELGPVERVFADFDFRPIGSASIACVYKARLWDGDVVAVKVRRPSIIRRFKTDLAAIDLVFRAIEFTTLLRPRVSTTLRSELRQMLLEELDFTVEARYQELFRTYFKKRKKLRTTAPRIYPELCTRKVLVSEFVDGISLKTILDNLDESNPDRRLYREELRALRISPKKIAKQLIRGSHYGFFECPLFHGDPHPGNVLVQPGNRLVMVDFGACGVFAHRERYQLAQMHEYHAREDVGGMVQCVIGLMEPLPPIDVDDFRHRLEEAWWKGFYGIKSKYAKWWERTSFRLWSALFREVRRAHIPLPLNVLRMIRATLLYDSVAARLYGRIDVFKEYRWYYHGYARRVRADIHQAVIRTIFRGPAPANYVRLQRLWEVGNLALRQAQILLSRPLPDFSAAVSKGWDVLKIVFRWAMAMIFVTAVTLVVGVYVIRDHVARVFRAVYGQAPNTMLDYSAGLLKAMRYDAGQKSLTPPEWLFIITVVLLAVISLKYLNELRYRLGDKDIYRSPLGGTR
jgi:ubiquinone biosynthesis protein